MARGNRIIVSANPKGHFQEVIVDGTPKPGTIMTVKPGTTPDGNGTPEYEAAGASAGLMAADGDRIPIAVLLSGADGEAACPPGRTATDAYVDGDRATVYFPIAGETLNVLFGNQAGTGDDLAAGTTKMIVDDGTGKLLPTASTPESEPFIALENYTDPAADKLVHALFTGY